MVRCVGRSSRAENFLPGGGNNLRGCGVAGSRTLRVPAGQPCPRAGLDRVIGVLATRVVRVRRSVQRKVFRVTSCQQDRVRLAGPRGGDRLGGVAQAGAPPVLVVGGREDSQTPYEWAGSITSQLEGSVLLTREGYGHGSYRAGAPCVDAAVDRLLVDGTLPAPGTTCPGPPATTALPG